MRKHQRSLKNHSWLWIVPILIVVFQLASPTVGRAQSNNSWFDTPYFDGAHSIWMVKITSMVRKRMTCTVSWKGIKTGSTAFGVYDTGASVSGSFTLQVPAYPGRGPAVIVQKGVKNVGNFTERTACNN